MPKNPTVREINEELARKINEEALKNSQYVVASSNLLLCFIWIVGAAISRITSPREKVSVPSL